MNSPFVAHCLEIFALYLCEYDPHGFERGMDITSLAANNVVISITRLVWLDEIWPRGSRRGP